MLNIGLLLHNMTVYNNITIPLTMSVSRSLCKDSQKKEKKRLTVVVAASKGKVTKDKL